MEGIAISNLSKPVCFALVALFLTSSAFFVARCVYEKVEELGLESEAKVIDAIRSAGGTCRETNDGWSIDLRMAFANFSLERLKFIDGMCQLDAPNTATSDSLSKIGFHPQLKSLNLDFATGVNSIDFIPNVAPNLKLLGLNFTSVSSVDALGELPHLRSVVLTETDITDKAGDILLALPSLEILAVNSCDISSHFFDQIANAESLKQLTVDRRQLSASVQNRLSNFGVEIIWAQGKPASTETERRMRRGVSRSGQGTQVNN